MTLNPLKMTTDERFNQIWVENRFRCRKTLKGTRMVVDPETGYMLPIGRDGFTAQDRKTFVERFRICDNFMQISKSIPIDIQSFYDALAVDTKFRNDINEISKIPNRPKQLNNSLVQIQHKEKADTIKQLAKAAESYRGSKPRTD